ncbi:MAG: hypothetical protein AB7F22_09525 [Reyranella sp.]|uniref:hypothetical protein n=1 Tax=Reyranella sp. TaxID=1929291 RepID=UPI003D097667
MAEPITDEFAMATGIAALVLVQATLEQMQELGVPSSKIDEIITRSLQIVATVSANQPHAALPISAKLLREMLHKRQSMRKQQRQHAMH